MVTLRTVNLHFLLSCHSFFANDNTHYSRWGTIHLHDMLTLHQNSPIIYNGFISGNFVLHECHRIFSAVALDKAHEHNNRFVKSDGGVIGITEKNSPFALDDFRASKCKLVKCYEDSVSDNTKTSHPEDVPSEQKKFPKDIKENTELIKNIW